MSKKSVWKKIWDISTTVIVSLVVAFAIFLMGARICGLKVYTVLSGSMAPTYHTGDLIFVKEVSESAKVEEGTPITFVLNEDLDVATHRVVRVDYEKKCFYTKGDANSGEDAAPVLWENLIGVPKFNIPLLGYVSNFVQNPPGMWITIALGLILIIAVFIPDILKKKPAPQTETKEKTVENQIEKEEE